MNLDGADPSIIVLCENIFHLFYCPSGYISLYPDHRKKMIINFTSQQNVFDLSFILVHVNVIVLNLLLDDHQRQPNQDTKEIDDLLVEKLLITTTIKNLRPQPIKGRDFSPGTFLTIHFLAVEEMFHRLPLSDDTRRIIQAVILPGIKHLLIHEEKIVNHMAEQYGVLYYLDEREQLPMHTDHVDFQDVASYRVLLRRLKENLFGAFYVCREAGKAIEFFEHLSTGYCLEGRIRELLAWAAKLSEIKPLSEFMNERINEYRAYSAYFLGQTEQEYACIPLACEFILKRFREFPCQPDPLYAPQGEVTEVGVVRFLEEVLAYSDGYESRCIIS